MSSRRLAGRVVFAALVFGVANLGSTCGAGRAAVDFRLDRTPETPRDAQVYIDEEYIGTLATVIARGVRLPVGEHRITVEREGYFPWDALVESDRKPIHLRVELVRIPD